jgi:hypothetical protein
VSLLSPRPCCLFLLSLFYLVSNTGISNAFPVTPSQQTQFTSSAKQGFGVPRRTFCNGDAATTTLLPRNGNTQATRSAVPLPPRCALQLSSSSRNQDNKDNVSINLVTSTSTTSNNNDDIRNKEEYQAQVTEIQRLRRNRATNKSSTTQVLVSLGVLCCFIVLFVVVTLNGGD